MMSRRVILVFLLLCVGCYSKISLSKYFRTCQRDAGQSELNSCLLAAVKEGLVGMAGGIPEVGFPPLDPHVQKEIKIHYGNNQIAATVVVKDIVSTGLKEAKVHAVRAKIDDDRFHLEVDVTQKRVQISGQYSAVGRYNTLKINSSGEFNATMRKLKFTWKLEGTPEKTGEDTFVRITKFDMRPDVGDMKFYASNIFPDNQELTHLANNVANQNWRLLYRELLPFAQSNWDTIGKDLANKLFLSVPYQELFPH